MPGVASRGITPSWVAPLQCSESTALQVRLRGLSDKTPRLVTPHPRAFAAPRCSQQKPCGLVASRCLLWGSRTFSPPKPPSNCKQFSLRPRQSPGSRGLHALRSFPLVNSRRESLLLLGPLAVALRTLSALPKKNPLHAKASTSRRCSADESVSGPCIAAMNPIDTPMGLWSPSRLSTSDSQSTKPSLGVS